MEDLVAKTQHYFRQCGILPGLQLPPQKNASLLEPCADFCNPQPRQSALCEPSLVWLSLMEKIVTKVRKSISYIMQYKESKNRDS